MVTYVIRNGEIVDKSTAPPKDSCGVYVISDIMPETKHMADGKIYTSKSEFRKATRAAGCVEVGNETKTLLQPRKRIELDRNARREAIQRSIYQLKNR